ncbi:hypothetical protein AXF42_Ash019395 [Apostasia shenzhenica]|uniref:Uncharacterized protein n=1 Tax=Apostasia shenzhenica TaxID=1088818 RepID=A0A2I0B4W3_9ASPA|nr:hypothetical protein AXF42_Ash019395 [Apostasia shenzhenica]
MRARLVVFPIRGRQWCFTRSLDRAASGGELSSTPRGFRDLFKDITSTRRSAPQNAEIVVDFVADKMNRAWATLENAPEGTVRSKLHSLGLWLLSRVKPSELLLKSFSDVTRVDITYPSSFNPRLVRRRVRHIAMRGSVIHKRHFYGSMSLLPLTSILTVLPLPNVPFFWILFRAYSHWKALKGSERLLLLVADSSSSWSLIGTNNKVGVTQDETDSSIAAPGESPWVCSLK